VKKKRSAWVKNTFLTFLIKNFKRYETMAHVKDHKNISNSVKNKTFSYFQRRFSISVPIEWRSKKTTDRSVFTVLNRKVGGKCIGSYGSSEKWPTIC